MDQSDLYLNHSAFNSITKGKGFTVVNPVSVHTWKLDQIIKASLTDADLSAVEDCNEIKPCLSVYFVVSYIKVCHLEFVSKAEWSSSLISSPEEWLNEYPQEPSDFYPVVSVLYMRRTSK